MTTRPVETLHDNCNAYPRAARIAALLQRTASEDFGDIDTVGAGGLIVYVEQTAVGTSNSFVDGADITLPVVIDGTHKTFKYGADNYTLATGTYSTLATLAAAIGAALHTATAFSTLVTVSVVGSHLRFTSVPTGVNTTAFAVGDTNDVLATATGITDGWTIAHTQAGVANGVSATVVTVQGVTPDGTAYTLLASASITAAGLTRLRISPGIAAVANAAASDLVPDKVRISVAQGNVNPVTYTITAVLTPEG